MTRFSTLLLKASLNGPRNPQPRSSYVFQVFKPSDRNLLTVLFLSSTPAASQQAEEKKESEEADDQVQKNKKKKKKVTPPEEGSFQHYALSKANEAQSNGGTDIGSSDSTLQVSLVSFGLFQHSYPTAYFNSIFFT